MTGRGEKGDLNKETYIDSFPGKLGTAMLGKEGEKGGGKTEDRGGRKVQEGVAKEGREKGRLKEEDVRYKKCY